MRTSFLFLFFLGKSILGFAQEPTQMHFYKIQDQSFEAVKAIAQKENKMIFMDVYTVWCGPCKLMDKNTFSDPKVAEKFNAEFIAYKVNAEDLAGRALPQEYKVYAYPTYLFFSPEGALINRLEGVFPPKNLMEEADYTKGLLAKSK